MDKVAEIEELSDLKTLTEARLETFVDILGQLNRDTSLCADVPNQLAEDLTEAEQAARLLAVCETEEAAQLLAVAEANEVALLKASVMYKAGGKIAVHHFAF